MGLPLGALLLAVAFLITTVAVVMAVRVQLSRKEEIPEVVYEVVGSPQLSPGPDPITTDVNVAYDSIMQTHPNAAYASTNFT